MKSLPAAARVAVGKYCGQRTASMCRWSRNFRGFVECGLVDLVADDQREHWAVHIDS